MLEISKRTKLVYTFWRFNDVQFHSGELLSFWWCQSWRVLHRLCFRQPCCNCLPIEYLLWRPRRAMCFPENHFTLLITVVNLGLPKFAFKNAESWLLSSSRCTPAPCAVQVQVQGLAWSDWFPGNLHFQFMTAFDYKLPEGNDQVYDGAFCTKVPCGRKHLGLPLCSCSVSSAQHAWLLYSMFVMEMITTAEDPIL